MKIAFDIDEVLSQTIKPFLAYYNKQNNTSFKWNDIKLYHMQYVFGISPEKLEKCFNDFFEQTQLKPYINSRKYVKELSKDNELMLITDREIVNVDKTFDWIKKYYDGLFGLNLFFTQVSGESKEDICYNEGVDVMVEDALHYAENCSFVCDKVLLMDKPWNQSKLMPQNLVRVKDWKKLYDVIKGE